MIGRTFSHYRILDTLGEGGMGIVFLAEDTHLHRQVAIKFPSCTSDEKQARRRFLGEARHASRLTHPHIAAVYDYGETEDGCPFIVMEFVRGEALADVIARGSLTPERAVEIALQIAEALEEAHTHGIVHRDIKPANVRLAERGGVKVLDFGLAKNLDGGMRPQVDPNAVTRQTVHTESGLLIGTPLYLSPEQFKGKPADARSDLFALGALLYECIAGRAAFSGANFVEIGAQVIHVEPPPLAQSAETHVLPELERVVRRLLAKDPAERYQTAAEVVADLRRLRPLLTQDAELTSTRLLHTQEDFALTGAVPLAPRHTNGANLTTVANLTTAPNADSTERLPPRRTLAERTLGMFRRTMTGQRLTPRRTVGLALGAAALTGLLAWLVLFAWRDNSAAFHAPTPEAARLYEAGVAHLRDGAPYGASKALQRAVEIDSAFALAHARLAEAWTELDYADRAQEALIRVGLLIPDRSDLPRREALRLEAVIATAMRDYNRAVASYEEIVQLEPSDAGAHLDLGRAQEKAENSTAALAAYTEATRHNSQYATAYLRQGILHKRAQNADAALAAFARAAELYEILSNTEGRTEVFYQRGVMFDRAGRLADAHRELRQALELARANSNEYQQINALLVLSAVSYAEGDTSRAAEQASEAIRIAQANNMETLTARGLIDLGNVNLVRGEYAEAEAYFRQARDLAERGGARYSVARATFMLGSLFSLQGNTNDSLPFVQEALAFFQSGGYRKEASQALTLLGRALYQQGDYAAALRAFEQQLQLARQVGDLEQQALAHESIGFTFSLQEKYPEALKHFDEGFVLDRASGNQLSIGYSLVNRGNMLWHLGRYEEAGKLFNEATTIAKQPSSDYKALSASVHLAKAQMALSERRFREASAEAEHAVAAIDGEQGDALTEAKTAICLAQSHSGAARAGSKLCEEALQMAESANNARLTSVVLLALAEASLMANDAAKASSLALRAREQFDRAGQQDSEWRAWYVAARAEQLKGDAEAAQRYTVQASAAFDVMRRGWRAEDFAAYLARPDIQYYWKQLDAHLAAASS